MSSISSRRDFIRRTSLASGALLLTGKTSVRTLSGMDQTAGIPRLISGQQNPLAIAMWDFSWILRHHRYGTFENWEKVLEELAERGYNAIRMDAMPQFVAADSDGAIQEEFRSVKDGWIPSLWGNDYTMSFNPREALMEFLPLCEKTGVKVGLASWFLRHGTSREDIFMEKGGLTRAWSETLSFLKKQQLLDNVIYVDVLNEYPFWHGYDWLKNELNKRSDIEQFKLDNPEANVPDFQPGQDAVNPLKREFYTRFIHQTIGSLKQQFPELEFFASLDSGMRLDQLDMSCFDALDYHIWFAHTGEIPGLGAVSSKDQTQDLRLVNNNLKRYWTENKESLIQWMDGRLAAISEAAEQYDIVCGNTEGWGPIFWYDHPELDWKWVKETAEICTDLALKYDRYKFLCTSNFNHPQFKGIWEDVSWHRKVTSKIKSGKYASD